MNSPTNASESRDPNGEPENPNASHLGGGPMAASHEHEHAQGYCREAIRDLYLYLDQELSSDQMAAVQIHLHECSPCFEAFDFEAELKMVIASRARDEAPEHLRDRLLAMLQSLDPPVV
jgi:mycothiol system anti-sigma-R factor